MNCQQDKLTQTCGQTQYCPFGMTNKHLDLMGKHCGFHELQTCGYDNHIDLNLGVDKQSTQHEDPEHVKCSCIYNIYIYSTVYVLRYECNWVRINI